ncbi:monovalent cation/H(+) antiporter subunit G [Halobacillus sp. ACCC02827]|uniref:monovalent cation/H(+) antiporter subunit G n=1 Tax=Bacillaceae TaxID=186817 RepID=UPI0002A52084|nr:MULTISPECIES: monovalent cation/H(+) antiporter subunit G [Bacillaceae]ELK45530.1 monovalent cation/H+ antiporter subunit G [Halobacillus sp. BAB-2008]WJE14467.1 monovalent cation/H(+) antiporter subunit G [Halobacillus sp. ACCC02827]
MSGTWINIIFDIIICLSLLSGAFFLISGSIGILRFPDVYTRLHAATKSSTLGVAGIMIGAFLFLYVEHDIVSGKLLLGIVFVLLSAPVSGHMISRAAYRSGVPLWENSIKDEYAEVLKEEQKRQMPDK